MRVVHSVKVSMEIQVPDLWLLLSTGGSCVQEGPAPEEHSGISLDPFDMRKIKLVFIL